MKFKLIIDECAEEQIIATVHRRTSLVDEIELLIGKHSGADRLVGYTEEGMKLLELSKTECITVLEGKTYAIDSQGNHYRLKQRLYELESQLPASFIRINKSALANKTAIDRFAVTYSGAVDAIFKCGYREYVSRRCFAQIKRRFS